MFGFLEGGQQSDASGLQIGCQSWAPVIAIAQDPTVGSFQDFFCHLQIVDIGWNQADPGNHAWPGDAHMRTQPKKGLSGHLIMSKSGPARDQFGAIGSRKATDGQRLSTAIRAQIRSRCLHHGLHKRYLTIHKLAA